MKNPSIRRWFICPAVVVLALVAPARALAQCDGLDGPVVKAAQRALDTRDPAPVLVWVQERDEAEIRAVFEQTLAVRALSPQARDLADRAFFETLVRVHRAGEEAPYTGLKPAGRDLGPAIPSADKAIDEEAIEPVVKLLTDAMQAGLRVQFKKVVTAKDFHAGDVAAGREYVRAYVEFIHYVERLHEATATPAHGHFEEADNATESR